jgi:hypothetical protein
VRLRNDRIDSLDRAGGTPAAGKPGGLAERLAEPFLRRRLPLATTQWQRSRGGWLERRRETKREKRQKQAHRAPRTSVIILSVALVIAAAELTLREDEDEASAPGRRREHP